METGGEEQVQSRGGEKRDRQKEMERERDTERERERVFVLRVSVHRE